MCKQKQLLNQAGNKSNSNEHHEKFMIKVDYRKANEMISNLFSLSREDKTNVLF